MSAVPVTIRGTLFPRDKSGDPYPVTLVGWGEITGLEIGGGPILPPDEVPPIDPMPDPPLVIWGGPIDPYPDAGLPMPQPPRPPEQVPNPPVPPHEGWNWSAAKSGWYYLFVPGPTDPQPHNKK